MNRIVLQNFYTGDGYTQRKSFVCTMKCIVTFILAMLDIVILLIMLFQLTVHEFSVTYHIFTGMDPQNHRQFINKK